ncbi:MAG: hypothetical protein WD738_06210 [Pirellulales bacterium]
MDRRTLKLRAMSNIGQTRYPSRPSPLTLNIYALDTSRSLQVELDDSFVCVSIGSGFVQVVQWHASAEG